MQSVELALDLGKAAGRRKTIHRRLFDQLRAAVLDGRLLSGERLPSTRELSERLSIARNTAARVYEDLIAAGYAEGRAGSGTFVSSAVMPPQQRQPRRRPEAAPPPFARPAVAFDFRPGTPDWDAFPRALWLRLLGRALRRNAAELSRYGEPAGYFPLRRAIAQHLAISRGVNAQPEQVVIVNGSQQAINLIARGLLGSGDRVAVEDPGYPDARRNFAAVGARLVPLRVDRNGISLDRLGPEDPRLVYVTPSHQFPTGVTLSLARRLALLRWAAASGGLIVEDDYDSELHDRSRWVESLQGLDRWQRVIYVGTFSTVLFPPLRVAYVVLPEGLVKPFVEAKLLADRQTPTLEQLALFDFIEEGHFERHLRKSRRLVILRRQALREAASQYLGGRVTLSEESSGMHLMMTLTSRRSLAEQERIVGRAAEMGVGIYSAAQCYTRPRKAAFVLGYAAMSPERIREGIETLAQALPAG